MLIAAPVGHLLRVTAGVAVGDIGDLVLAILDLLQATQRIVLVFGGAAQEIAFTPQIHAVIDERLRLALGIEQRLHAVQAVVGVGRRVVVRVGVNLHAAGVVVGDGAHGDRRRAVFDR